MRINDPDVVRAVTAAFLAYETALIDNDVETLSALFWNRFVRRDSTRRGRQSQTWIRTESGWRVVSAHVSLLPAHD